MFLEAYNLDKWKEVYGTNILTNLGKYFELNKDKYKYSLHICNERQYYKS